MKKMNKKSRLMIIVVAVLLMAVAVYFYVRSPKEDKETTDPILDIEDPVSPTVSKPAPKPKPTGKNWDNSLDYNKILKKGDRGSMVQFTQQAINRSRKLHKMPPISEDGVFGKQTETSIKNMTGKTSASYNTVKKAVVYNFKKKGLPDPYAQLVVDVVAPLQTQTTWSMGAPNPVFPQGTPTWKPSK